MEYYLIQWETDDNNELIVGSKPKFNTLNCNSRDEAWNLIDEGDLEGDDHKTQLVSKDEINLLIQLLKNKFEKEWDS